MNDKFYHAKISDVLQKHSEKCGDYIAIEFSYQDGDSIKKGYKNFYINYPKSDVASKARQILYAMTLKKTKLPSNDYSVLLDAEVIITLTVEGQYTNVNLVYFVQ